MVLTAGSYAGVLLGWLGDDMIIRFGVLHLLGFAMMLSPLLKRMINPSYAELDYNVPYVRKLLAGGLLAVSGVAAAAVLTAKLFKD